MALFHSQTRRHMINGVISPPDATSYDKVYVMVKYIVLLSNRFFLISLINEQSL